MELTVTQASDICEIIEQVYGVDATVYENHSGGGMFGDTVNGISTTCTHYQIGIAVVLWLEQNYDHDEVCEILSAEETPLQRSVNLGLGKIYY